MWGIACVTQIDGFNYRWCPFKVINELAKHISKLPPEGLFHPQDLFSRLWRMFKDGFKSREEPRE